MGVNLKSIIPSKEIELVHLSGKKVAVDAMNNLFQYLTIIRDRMTGEPLRDSKGRVTSHLSGLFYRTTNWMEFGIRPVFCFDGTPPAFKKSTIEKREALKKLAEAKYKEAKEKGEPTYKFAQVATRMTNEMLQDSKKLLDYMGIPWVQAPSEGEMQCSYMCKKGDVWSAVSQDMDCLLDGSPRLIRNLSITGRRKLPNKQTYIDVKPELIELSEVLARLGISQ